MLRDEQTRQMIAEAFAFDDATREKHEQQDRQRLKRQQIDAQQHIIRKTYEPPAQQHQCSDLDPVTQARWDDWLDRRVHGHLEEFAGDLGKEVALADNAVIKMLREEIGSLRADIAVLQGIVKGDIAHLGKGKSRDAA